MNKRLQLLKKNIKILESECDYYKMRKIYKECKALEANIKRDYDNILLIFETEVSFSKNNKDDNKNTEDINSFFEELEDQRQKIVTNKDNLDDLIMIYKNMLATKKNITSKLDTALIKVIDIKKK